MQPVIGCDAHKKFSVFISVDQHGKSSRPVRVDHNRDLYCNYLLTLLSHLDEVKGLMSHYYLFQMMYGMEDDEADRNVLEMIRTAWKSPVNSSWQTTWESLADGGRIEGSSLRHSAGILSQRLRTRCSAIGTDCEPIGCDSAPVRNTS